MIPMLIGSPPRSLPAQDSVPRDSTPFRRGQWALQFGAGASLASVGALKFTTPTRAWLLDLQLTAGHSHSTTRFSSDTVADEFFSHAQLTARVGRRFYEVRHREVAGYQTLGVLAGFTHLCSGTSGFQAGGGFCANGWTAGAFGELGGAYLLTSHLSIGGGGAASFSYSRTWTRSSAQPKQTTWSYEFSFQGFSFTTTIYF
jgi:hypothetical protein